MTKLALVTALFLAVGCSSKPGSGSGSGSDPDDVDSGVAADCGTYGFKISGAMSYSSPVVTTVTRDGAVIGVAGFYDATPFALAIYDSITADIDGVGSHDISAAHLDFLDMPASGMCSTPGTCHGFVAMSGSFVVTSATPYVATFTLGDLYAYDGSSTAYGAAIPGEVTGCVVTQ
jgi:hypothetical protein